MPPAHLILSSIVFIVTPHLSISAHPHPSPSPFLFTLWRKVLVAQPACRALLLLCWHVTVAPLCFFLFLFTNRRRPNWSMPALRSLNRACSLKRPKLTNSCMQIWTVSGTMSQNRLLFLKKQCEKQCTFQAQSRGEFCCCYVPCLVAVCSVRLFA